MATGHIDITYVPHIGLLLLIILMWCVWQGEAEIQIRVTDTNDNAPFFSERVYTARVPENTDIGTIVMTVTAEDLDEGLSVYLSVCLLSVHEWY